jgi:hypothetical protein
MDTTLFLDHLRLLFDNPAIIEGAAESVERFPLLEKTGAVLNTSFPHTALQKLVTTLAQLKASK